MEQLTGDIFSGEQNVAQKLRTRMWVERGLFVALAAAGLAYYGFAFRVHRGACVINIDGKPAVVVESTATAEHLLSQLKRAAGPIDNVGFVQQVTLQRISEKGASPRSEAEALKELTPRLTAVAPGVGIFVNGRLLYGFADRQQAVGAISLLLRELSPPDPGLTRAFQEEVKVASTQVPVDKFLPSADAAFSRIRQALTARKAHHVQPGDSPWKIANEYGISISSLKRANPQVDFLHLAAGDTVMVPTGSTPLTVVAWKEVSEMTSDGPQVLRVTYVNGVETGRQVVLRPRKAKAEAPEGGVAHTHRRSRRSSHTADGTTTRERRRPKGTTGDRTSRPSTSAAGQEPVPGQAESAPEPSTPRTSDTTPSWQESDATP